MFLKSIIKKILRHLDVGKEERDINIRYIGSQRPKLEIGAHTYINGMIVYCWDATFEISVGRYCSLADNIMIIAGGEHDKEWVSTYPFIDRWKLTKFASYKKPRKKGNISIGNDVWIANGVTILSGVDIGDGAVVGAGAVVTKPVPPYAVVAGNPARVIKYRFGEELIEKLREIQWWNWNEQEIIDNHLFFFDPEKFAQEFSK